MVVLVQLEVLLQQPPEVLGPRDAHQELLEFEQFCVLLVGEEGNDGDCVVFVEEVGMRGVVDEQDPAEVSPLQQP